jgi:hypothetical protein
LRSVTIPRPERREEGEVPQLFADMLGWEERVAAVARALVLGFLGRPIPEPKGRLLYA